MPPSIDFFTHLRTIIAKLAYSGILCILPLYSANAAEPATSHDVPNIVLILADDLGINDLSCYGRKDQSTPHLDRLAAEGVRFTSAYCAQPICSPSRAAIMTGRTPARLHLTTFLPGRSDAPSQLLLHPKITPQLPRAEITLAEHLKDAGYATGCFGKWHLGGQGFGPLEQGFETYFAGKANTQPTATEGGKGEFELTEHACDFMHAHRDRPFFVFLSHNTPHIPLAAAPEKIQRHRDAFHPLYAAVIESMDDSVGRVVKTLDELQLAKRTVVIFTSDNGGLHVRELDIDPPTHNTPFRAGKGFVYEGGLRVPTIIRYPGRLQPRVSDQPWINTDLLPTLLSFARVAPPANLDGQNVAALWSGETPSQDRTLYWHFPHYTNQGSRPAGAVREGRWKLIEHYEDGALELYDLSRDPGEVTDLAPTEAGRAASLRTKLHAWRTEISAQDTQPNPDFDAAAHRKLYVDFDVTRPTLKPTAAAMGEDQREWRKGMDEAVRRKPNAKK